jgi:ribonucleoside-diphosphate reductase beta chain
MSVFKINDQSHLTRKVFLDGSVDIQRYEKVKYPVIDQFTEQQLGYFWRPQEVEIYQDQRDFKNLSKHEQFIWTQVLLRAIVLDSVQGRGPVGTFGPIVSLPELEAWLNTWQFFETIHSKSYTYIIQNVFPDPSKVFDQISEVKELVECTDQISKYYDELELLNAARVDHKNSEYFYAKEKSEYAHKKAIWKALVAVAALEGIRFFSAFVVSWAFAETKRMEGNAQIIRLIARDENLHLGVVQTLLKILPKDDPDFARIKKETEQECIDIIRAVVEQEVNWVKHIFQTGSMIGLNENLLTQYNYWKSNKLFISLGYPAQYDVSKNNPLPWTERWINSSSVQGAAQEVTKGDYIGGAVKQDLTPEFLKGLSL